MANRINVVLDIDTGPFERSLNAVSKRMQRFGQELQNAGSTLTQAITVPLAGIGAASIKAFADMDRLTKGLSAVMGSAELAEAELVKLREVAKLPGLGFREAVQGSVNLQAVGLSAEEARKTLQGFGAAIATTGGGATELQEVQRQLTQIISKNRILQEDYGVLQERVPLIGEALQAAFGTKNIENVRAMGIGGQEFVQRISEALIVLPQTQNLTGGLANAFENLQDSLRNSAAQMGAAINKAVNLEGFITRLGEAVQRAADGFGNLSSSQQKFIVIATSVSAAIGPVLFVLGKLVAVGPVITTALKGIGSALAFITGPVGIVVAAIAALVAGIVIAYKRSAEFRDFVDRLGVALKFVLVKAFEAARQEINNVIGVMKALAPLFKPVWEAVVFLAKIFFERFKFIAGITFDVAKIIVSVLVGAARSVRSAFSVLFTELKEDFAALGKGVKQIFEGDIRGGIKTITGEAKDTGRNFGEAFKTGFQDGFKDTQAFFKNVAGAFNNVVRPTVTQISDGFKDAAKDLPTSTLPRALPTAPINAVGTGNKKKIDVIAQLPTLNIFNEGLLTAFAGTKGLESSLTAIKILTGEIDPAQIQFEGVSASAKLFEESIKGVYERVKAAAEPVKSSIKSIAQQMSESMQKVVDFVDSNIVPVLDSLNAVFSQGFSNRQAAIDSYYDKEKSRIEGSTLSEENKAAALKRLDEETDKRRRKLARDQAIRDKLVGIVSAIINTAQGVTKALASANLPLAAIIGGLGAVQIGLIAGQKIPALARGGLVTSEQLVTVGDNPSGKEAIIPFERMGEFLNMAGGGGATRVTGVFEVKGSDLILVLDRAKQEQTRIR